MTETEIERCAEDVLSAFGVTALPIDPFAIAGMESIRLIPGDYDGCFDSRIEARMRSGRHQFDLFYAEPIPHFRPVGRVRFSIGHELGHFYLPTHRRYLLSGDWHGSKTGFLSESTNEREADQFSAALLLPRKALAAKVRLRPVSSIGDLVALADSFATSLTSTVIRYVQLGFEPCGVVVSEKGRALYSIGSPDFKARGLGWIPRGSPVPVNSVTTRLLARQGAGPSSESGSVDSGVWFDSRGTMELWEEARLLGESGLALTFLVVENADDHDD